MRFAKGAVGINLMAMCILLVVAFQSLLVSVT